MNRNFTVLGKTRPVSSNDSPEVRSVVRPREYTELIQRLFQGPSVVAIIGAGSGGVTGICEGLASELSHLGRRVVLVSVNAILQTGPMALSAETVLMPGGGGNVWLWPSPVGQQIEVFKSRTPALAKHWLDYLRHNFDSVLLDCPAFETLPGGAVIAAMGEAAVLAVDAVRTPKRRILRDQRLLLVSGVKLAGCILIKAK